MVERRRWDSCGGYNMQQIFLRLSAVSSVSQYVFVYLSTKLILRTEMDHTIRHTGEDKHLHLNGPEMPEPKVNIVENFPLELVYG